MPKERTLGLDIGTKRIGVAISDPLFITAQPLKAVFRNNDALLFTLDYYKKVDSLN